VGVLQLSLQELKAPLQWHPPQRALDAGTRTHGDEEAIVARFAYALALKRIVCPQERARRHVTHRRKGRERVPDVIAREAEGVVYAIEHLHAKSRSIDLVRA
jgi:hypothetical protein